MHDTVQQGSVESQMPHWRVIFEFEAPPPNVMGVDVKGPTIIGRSVPEIGFTVDLNVGIYTAEAKGVSRKHAALIPDDEGVLLVDLGSTNGTFINDAVIESGQRHRIHAGDAIRMSELKMHVRVIRRLNDSHSTSLTS